MCWLMPRGGSARICEIKSRSARSVLNAAAAPVPAANGSEVQARRANERLVGTAVDHDDIRSGQAVNDKTSAKSTAYTIEATAAIGNMMKDPTSYTVLQVIALTKQRKDGRTSFRGCVHYVGSFSSVSSWARSSCERSSCARSSRS
jgi:hypothetical protein